MSNFFRNLVEDIKDEDTSIAADGNAASEYNGCIDTGSYILNAVLSALLRINSVHCLMSCFTILYTSRCPYAMGYVNGN